MTAKEMRFALLEANQCDVVKAKRCYDFVQGDEPAQSPTGPAAKEEGIYLIYADGRNELYDGTNTKEGVVYIGVSFRGVRFAISLTESKAALLPDDATPTERDSYMDRECDALHDFDSAANTARLLEDNPRLVDHLKACEAIPALGVLVIMCYLREGINRVLEYVGGQLLTDIRYWSSTEYSEYGAWSVHFSSGSVNIYGKYGSYALRAVAAF